MIEGVLVTGLLSSTGAQLHILGPLFMAGMYFGAPVLAAILTIQND